MTHINLELLTTDEQTMLEWLLSEFRANCGLLHPGINQEKCSRVINNLADKFSMFYTIRYQEALKIAGQTEKEAMVLLNQIPPEDFILSEEE